jgi:Dienelactone hydrolase and related enzymes
MTTKTASTSRVTIQRERIRLAAEFVLPAGTPPFPCVLFVHGLGSGKDSPRNVVVASRLVDVGIAALLFDLSGHGESDDDPRSGLQAFVEDLEAVFDWVTSRPEVDPERIGVAGSSLGGVVALETTRRRLIHPAALVLRAPPAEPHEFAHLDIPTLVIAGSHDPLLPMISQAVTVTECATLAQVEGAGHLFEEPGTLEQAVQQTVEWFKGHLSGAPEPPVRNLREVD